MDGGWGWDGMEGLNVRSKLYYSTVMKNCSGRRDASPIPHGYIPPHQSITITSGTPLALIISLGTKPNASITSLTSCMPLSKYIAPRIASTESATALRVVGELFEWVPMNLSRPSSRPMRCKLAFEDTDWRMSLKSPGEQTGLC